MITKRIDFETICNVWQSELWPNRTSPIESHSAMTWPFEGDPQEIDMNIFTFTPTFWGIYMGDNLVGVNSGHKSSDTQYRSRGIWVNPNYRRKGIAQRLFVLTERQARDEECEMIWSIPRKTALSAYTNFGFETVGGYIKTETSDSNIYVKKIL
jgi:GNAT superfamily N-acetyltransferase